MKIRGLNKRGMETSPMSIIISIVILAVVAITIIYFFTGGFGKISSKFEFLPGDLEVEAQACKLYSESNLAIDYCDFKEVEKNNYVNCKYIKTNFGESYDFEAISTCDGDLEKEFCDKNIKSKDLEKVYMNDQTCKSYATNETDGATSP